MPQPLRTVRGVYAGDVKEFAVYTLSRIGLFVAAYAIVVGVYLLVTGGSSVPLLWPVIVAALLSSVASVTMLRRQRERFAASVEQRARRAAAGAARVAGGGAAGVGAAIAFAYVVTKSITSGIVM